MTLNELRDKCHAMAVEKGWYESGHRNIGEALMLVVTEVAEAMEEARRSNALLETYFLPSSPTKPEGFPIELADVLIRVFDLAGSLGVDLDEAVRMKMEYNATRPHRHGGKLA